MGSGAPAPAQLGCAGSSCREGIPGEQSALQAFVLPEPRCAHRSAAPLGGSAGLGTLHGGKEWNGARWCSSAGDQERVG